LYAWLLDACCHRLGARSTGESLGDVTNLGEEEEGVSEDLISYLKTEIFEAGVDDLGIGTMIAKDVEFAKESRHVTIKTATSEFRATSPEDAKNDFIAIFGVDVYNTVSGNE